MTGPITLAGNATLPLHAVPLQQVNSASAGGPFLPTSGGALSGPLLMTGYSIQQVADPVAATDALNLRMADARYTAAAGGPFLPADGTKLPTSKVSQPPGTYWRNGDFVCIV
jgi:hypothetical protein